MRRLCIGLITGLLAITASPSMAAYSGLTIVPIADTVGANQYSIGLQNDGAIQHPDSETAFFNTEFGVGDRFEAGVDFDIGKYADNCAIVNAKYVLVADAKHGFYLAAGTSGVESREKPSPYLVATGVFRCCRLHLGEMRIDGNNRWFVGADKNLGDKWTLISDYTNGDDNYSSLSVNYQVTDNFGIFCGAEFPNTPGETLYTMQLVFGGSILHSPPGECAKQD